MRLPEPDYHTLLGLSLNSRYEDEALAASHKLAEHINLYHELIESLENAFDPGNREILRRIEVVLKTRLKAGGRLFVDITHNLTSYIFRVLLFFLPFKYIPIKAIAVTKYSTEKIVKKLASPAKKLNEKLKQK